MVDIVTWRARIGLFCVNVGPSGRRAKVLRPFPQWSLLSSMATSSLVHLLHCVVIAVIGILLLVLSGDVEINPGPRTVADDNTAVYEVFREHFDQLVRAMGTSPTALIPVLYSKRLIGEDVKDDLSTLTGVSNNDKAIRLLNAVEKTMKADPKAARVVRELCEAVNDQPALRHVADRITTTLDLPASSYTIATTHTYSPALRTYIDYLKDRYINKSPELKERKLKIRPKDYVHLNLVSKVAQEENKEFKNECLLSQLRGDVAAIKKKRTPMEMEDIGSSEKLTQHILVEGSPGVGKTVMSWEICRQWAEGNMLQKWDIVLMLQLRSRRVRQARELSDLFYHDNDHIKQEVLEHVTSLSGKGVLLLLEGFDELTEDQKKEGSLVNNLLTGDCLPKASILVTSRPLASESLCPEFRECVDQHIEVVGFNEEDVRSYVKAACQNQPEILPDILSYMTSNPFVSSVMYIPLQCVILTALYIEKWNKKGHDYAPATLTQLYTDLLVYLLVRYMSNYPNYSQYRNITQLSELPPWINDQVRQLSQLAAEGLEKKQFIFDNITCDHMGLMMSTEEESITGKSDKSYCFLHLTLQEYLAALHWSKKDSRYLVRLVKEANLFPLDVIVRNGITKASGYHWPALYFLSGLLKLNTSVIFDSNPITVASDRLDIECQCDWTLCNDVLNRLFDVDLLPFLKGISGKECDPYFFQLLFESQSRSLTSKVLLNQKVFPMLRNRLECYITAWCVTHSGPATQWNITFVGFSAFAEFVKHYEKFTSESHGLIVGFQFYPSASKEQNPEKLVELIPTLFPFLELLDMIPVYDSYVRNILSIVHKLKNLKTLSVGWYVTDSLPIPLQPCPSLKTIALTSRASCSTDLLRSLVFPNINALSFLHVCFLHRLSDSDFHNLCTQISQSTSLNVLIASHVKADQLPILSNALKKSASLKMLSINGKIRITDVASQIAWASVVLPPERLIKFQELLQFLQNGYYLH